MFAQPDWFEVQTPGVGTNRYSYSANDPVNGLDPSGNLTVYKDIDGDGENEYYGYVSPEVVGDGWDIPGMPSEWVDNWGSRAVSSYGDTYMLFGGSQNPLFANATATTFAAATGWDLGYNIYVKDPKKPKNKLKQIRPDLIREVTPGKYAIGELKAGKFDGRRRSKDQARHYSWTRNGFYDKKGNRLGTVTKVQYFVTVSKANKYQITPGARRLMNKYDFSIKAIPIPGRFPGAGIRLPSFPIMIGDPSWYFPCPDPCLKT